MRGKLALLLAASSTISGYASGEQSLQQAIDRILANNCRGTMDTGGGFSGGLLAENEVTFYDVTENIGDPFNVVTVTTEDDDGNLRNWVPPDIWFDANEDGFGLLLTALPSDPNAQLGLNTPGDVEAYIQFLPATESLEASARQLTGFGPVAISGEDDEGNPVEESITGISTDVFVFAGVASAVTTPLQFFTVSAVERQLVQQRTDFGPDPLNESLIGLGSELRSVCTTIGETSTGFIENGGVSEDFTFNANGGLQGITDPSSISPSSLSTTGLSGTAGSNGAQALQDRELTLRRDQSLWSRIQRLWSRGDRERDRRRREQAALRPYKVAALGSYAPAPQPAIRDYSFVTDLSGGAVNVDRSATDLEGAFSADSFVVNAGAGVLFHGNGIEGSTLLLGGALSYEETQADGESLGNSGQTQSFRSETESETLITSAFASWTSGPIGGDAEQGGRLNLTASYSFGTADTNYSRDFSTTIERDGVEDRIIRDIFKDDVDQTFQTLTVRGSYNHQLGDLTLTPRASASWVRFETDAHEEESIASGTSSLALRYEAVEDDWTELRVGAAATYRAPTGRATALRLGVGVDAVFVGDAETPERTAFFAQDLRANPTPIVYSVDDLDSEYFDINLSIALENGSRFEPYLAGFSRQGHDYLDTQGGLIGIRTVF